LFISVPTDAHRNSKKKVKQSHYKAREAQRESDVEILLGPAMTDVGTRQ